MRKNPFVCLCGCLVLCVWVLGLVGCTSPGGGPGDAGEQVKDAAPPPPPLPQEAVRQHVNPMIGTGGAGFAVGSALPGATAPFGMAKISPDTAGKDGLNFSHCGGYAYDDKTIVGFSHIHVHGTGVPDYGNLLVMPIQGEADAANLKQSAHEAHFTHEQEEAKAGYYAVTLQEPKVRVELTATVRTAHHRYTYSETDKAHTVLLRLDHALPEGDVSDAQFTVTSDKTIEGWLHSQGGLSKRAGGFKLYFALRTRQPFSVVTWKDDTLDKEKKAQSGARIGAFLQFASTHKVVEMQVGLSFSDLAHAKDNLAKEAPTWDFDGTRKRTEEAWEALLGRVKVAGGSATQRRIFYSALYHAYQMPTILSDADGTYRGFDGKLHKAEGFVYYSDFSMWDTYRTLHPLLVLLLPKHQNDMVRSLLQMAREGGYLPRWPLATGYTGTMVGASADIVIADTYLKGIKDFDVQFAYSAMRSLAMKAPPAGSAYGGRRGIKHYVEKGFVDAANHGGAASVTLEFAYNDFAIAQLAQALGKTDDHKLFMERSRNYRHVWDPKTQFFRAKKADGSWLTETLKPTVWTKDFVEGTAWQYLFFVPHDIDGLSALFGGREATLKKLDEFFENSKFEYDSLNRKLGLKKYYWHGNEPDLHVATLYLLLGRPADSHKWMRWIMETRYKDAPDGLAGNDDAGTLSAWYAFAAMGLYPIPARDIYLIVPPVFTRTQLTLGDKTIEILAPNASDENKYVKAAWLNGKRLENLWLKHTELVADGNTLRLEMSNTP